MHSHTPNICALKKHKSSQRESFYIVTEFFPSPSCNFCASCFCVRLVGGPNLGWASLEFITVHTNYPTLCLRGIWIYSWTGNRYSRVNCCCNDCVIGAEDQGIAQLERRLQASGDLPFLQRAFSHLSASGSGSMSHSIPSMTLQARWLII